MKCLTFGQLLYRSTLALVFLVSAVSYAVEFSVPGELVIEVSGIEIKGSQGDPEILKQLAAEIVANPDSPQAKDFPLEGFIYKKNDGIYDGFEVVAWSSTGRRDAILKVARDTLTDLISEQMPDVDKPVGLAYSARSRMDFKTEGGKTVAENSEVPKAMKGPKAPASVKEVPEKKAPVLVVAKVNDPAIFEAAVGQIPTDPMVAGDGSINWKFVFILFGSAIILLLAVRFGFLA